MVRNAAIAVIAVSALIVVGALAVVITSSGSGSGSSRDGAAGRATTSSTAIATDSTAAESAGGAAPPAAINAAPTGTDASSVDLLNATLPSGTCGDGSTGWPHDPIPLVNGEGESVDVSGGFGGASVTDATVLGYADFDGDGTDDALLSLSCLGSPIAMCCAGRASILTFAVPVTVGADGSVQLIGGAITGGYSNEAMRAIREISLTGTTVVTTELIVYPEQYTEADVGHPPFDPVTVSYDFDGSRWVARP